MLRNYLLLAARSLLKSKLCSTINIAGLALGLTCTILILMWVRDEMSYDRFHPKAHVVYRVEEDQHYAEGIYHVNVTPYPVGPAFKEEIPEVVDFTRYAQPARLLFQVGSTTHYETSIAAVDPSFFTMLAFPFVKGNPLSALSEPFSMVVTEDVAKRYFAEADPVGQTIRVGRKYTFTVTGVLAPVPRNSSYRFQIAVPIGFMRETGAWSDGWGNHSITTLVQLQEGAPLSVVNAKMTSVVREHAPASTTDFLVAPLTELHLHSRWGFGHTRDNAQYVYIFSAIAVLVLSMACLNYINLSTAQSGKRSREIGLRKVVGASRAQLARQFLGESILTTCLASALALPLAQSLMPAFNKLSGKQLEFDAWRNWPVACGLVGAVLFTGLVSGICPALVFSGYRPVDALGGRRLPGVRLSFRKALVVVQFALSVGLIVGTAVVYRQLDFMRGKDLGYDKEQLLYVPLRGEVCASYGTLKDGLESFSGVLGVTATQQLPSNIGSNSDGARWGGKDPLQSQLIGFNFVDVDFAKTLKIDIIDGRDFSRSIVSDKTEAFLVNEETARLMGPGPVVGRDFQFWGRKGKVIGVMKDFHFQSMLTTVGPLVVMIDDTQLNFMMVRLRAEVIAPSIDFLKKTWAEVVSDYPLEYRFLDQDLDRTYRAQEQMGDVMRVFAVVAVLIACLGLFGMASSMAEGRVREIGVRKVLGATIAQVLVLLTRDFAKWVVFAALLACPAAGLIMQWWLQGFAYRTDLTPGIFLQAGLLTLVVALLTVSYHAIRAAVSDPVNSLRSE